MVDFLTQEWCDETVKIAAEHMVERAGSSVRLQYRISGAPINDGLYWWIVEEGKLTGAGIGELDDAEVTLVMAYEDSLQIQQLQLDPQVAFMQGRMKVEGDMMKLMALLPITGSPDYDTVQRTLTERTTF